MSKDHAFATLIEEVRACTRCERMCDSARVLSFAAGNLHARLMFIGEAPGRLGADRTEIPFHGDAAGRNFEDLLAFAGIKREEVFVTNAALCNPKDDRGNNATPKLTELDNCSRFLARQIELVDPLIVATLGATALRSAGLLHPHRLNLATHVRTANRWFGRILVPLYHSGQRAMIHRSEANQRGDYQFLAEQLRRLGTPQAQGGAKTRADVLSVCRYILSKKGEVSYFELHKLLYLAEYLHVRNTGSRLTSAFFIRQKDGPYCADVQINRLKRSDPSISTVTRGQKLFVRLNTSEAPQLFPAFSHITEAMKVTLDEAITRYSFYTEADLKKAVYLTAPMRLMLRREKHEDINLYNAPIDFLVAR
jgi:uracil-DNA glycosylase family 4